MYSDVLFHTYKYNSSLLPTTLWYAKLTVGIYDYIYIRIMADIDDLYEHKWHVPKPLEQLLVEEYSKAVH